MKRTDDGYLLQRTAAGSRQAWEELRRRYSLTLYAQMIPVLGDLAEVDSVVTEVFEHAWCSAPHGDWSECESASTWLLGLARKVVFEHRQAEQRRRAQADGVAATVRPTAAATSRARPINSANVSSVSD